MVNKENETWVQKNRAELSWFFFLTNFYSEKEMDWAVGLFLGLVLAYGTFLGYNSLSSIAHPHHYYT